MEIINRLKQGNQQYLSLERSEGNISADIRQYTSENGQHPFAVIVACSDSRVIPEAIFNCGIGELFVIRTAGNTIGENEAGSIEYALDHLHVKAVIVLGHSNCGAVAAALHGEAHGQVSPIIRKIKLAIGEETVPYNASLLNARAAVNYLNELFKEQFPDVLFMPAMYDICTGKVDFDI